ncbi:hypothetical protein K474DRAFT_1017192 [Panus rudis PR-1116 ss-1]|nr:hypothetical protein K474DRAFT_1017192 [Panus rudis PR-1116 ss-1]
MASFKLLRALLPLSLSLCSIAFELPVSQLARRDGPPPTPSGVNGDIIFTDKAQEHIYIAVSVDDTNVAVAIDSVFSDLWVSGGISNPQRIGGTSYSYPGIASPVRADIAKARLGLAAANLTDQPYCESPSNECLISPS